MKRNLLAVSVTSASLLLTINAMPLAYAQAPALNPPAATTGSNSCTLTEKQFQPWQAAGGGFVSPDSAQFPSQPISLCQFFQWGSQMFLYLTSKNQAAGQINLMSAPFYSANLSGDSTVYTEFPSKGFKAGSAQSKSLFDIRVNKAAPSALKRLMARNAGPLPIDEGQAGGGGVLALSGAAMPVPNHTGLYTLPVAYYFVAVNDAFVALNNNVNTVDYYKEFDVNAQANNPFNFPIDLPEMTQIAAAANQAHNGTVTNPGQLALEVKTAWIDTAYLPAGIAASSFITIQADVPVFKPTFLIGSTVWTESQNVTATRTLALVGMHVVGSVSEHPEMIWATFESVFSAPNATFYYAVVDKNGKTTTHVMPWETSAAAANKYIFYNGGNGAPPAQPPVPVLLVKAPQPNPGDPVKIIATSGTAQSRSSPGPKVNPALPPTQVSRLSPWGLQQPTKEVDVNPTLITVNTNLASLQASLQERLPQGSAQANYFESGSQWLKQDKPAGPFKIPMPNNTALQIASLNLANTTMETFHQFGGPLPLNCFGCHNISPPENRGNPGTGISHTFNVPQ